MLTRYKTAPVTMELNAVVLARYSNPYRQQKQMERTVARKGKSR